MSSQEVPSQKKQHWWNNVASIYRVAKRGYPWIGWVCLAIFVACIGGISIALPLIVGSGIVSFIGWVLTGIAAPLLICTYLLTHLAEKVMYKEMDGVRGAVGAVLGQMKRGWIIEEQPVAMNRKQDIVWRLVGRPGIVLISEGPSSRVTRMLQEEERKAKRIVMSTPVQTIQVGHSDGQVEIAVLLKTLKKLPKTITKDEVPRIAQRLNSLRAKSMSAPKGLDPAKVKINRRMLRGK